MAHVGVIGLSLPYVAGLISGSEGEAGAVVPIELIVVEAESEMPLVRSPDLQGQENTSESEEVAAKPKPAHTAAAPASEQAPNVITSVNETAAETQPATPAEPEQDSVENNDSSSEQEDTTEEETEIDEAETDSPDPQSEGSTDEEQAIEEETATTDETPDGESTELPVVGGEQLPAPGGGSATQGTDQVTALSFSNHTLVADEFRRDRFAVTEPTPHELFTTGVRPQDVGCDKVSETPPMPLTYRVTISREGSIQEATPWTGSNVAPLLNESERSIICLLKHSGWQFTPATDEDGLPIPHSDLLLTFFLDLSTD